MKLLYRFFIVVVLGSFVSCISAEKSNNQPTRVLDGYYDSSLVSKTPKYDKWHFYQEIDSSFIVRSICNTDEESSTVTTRLVLEVDSESTNLGSRDRRILHIVTSKTNGKVLKVYSREGRYRSDLHYYQEKFRYQIELDSCKVSETEFGLYDWE